MEKSISELKPPTDERYQYEEEGDMTKSQTNSFAFHLYTLWRFTTSDIQSVIIPQTLLGLSTALSGGLLLPTPNPSTVLLRTPSITIWNWMNLLLFDIDNQFQPGSITEDTLNKPWRAIPSQRLTAQQARHCLLLVIPAVFCATLYLGGTREAVTLMVMTWMYNDLHGADVSIVTRNLLSAFGYMCYSSGSMRVAGLNTNESPTAKCWLALIGAVIFTTLQMQDMPVATVGLWVSGSNMRPWRWWLVGQTLNSLTVMRYAIVKRQVTMGSVICMAIAPAIGSSFESSPFRAIELFFPHTHSYI